MVLINLISECVTSEVKSVLTFSRSSHDNSLLMGDFSMRLNIPNFNELMGDHELSPLISEPACFKSTNPTCVDNFLTNKKDYFINTLSSETGVSDHHKPIGTTLRSTFVKGKPGKNYRCYKNFDYEKFVEELKKHLFLFYLQQRL